MESLLLALEPASRPVLQALLNGLGQGAALAAATALLLRVLPRTNAATRHLVWGGSLLLVAGLLLLPLIAVRPGGSAPGAAPTAGAAPGALSGWSLPAPPDPWPLLLLAALGAVAVLRVGLLLRELLGLRRLKRLALPLDEDRLAALRAIVGPKPLRGLRVGSSALAATPVTIGFRRPMILLPDRLLGGLTDAELRQVVLHELAHLRRRDDWTNLAQRILEAALWFHPAVRWIGSRMELEREIACDDQVVAALAEKLPYARFLTRLAELSVASRRTSLAPGAAPGRSQLARRVGALVAPDRPASLRVSPGGSAATLALLLGSAAWLLGAAPAIALTGAAPAAPTAPASVVAAPARAPAPPGPAEGAGGSSPMRAPAASAPAVVGVEVVAPFERLAALGPEPAVVAGCAAGLCGGVVEAPPIVQRAQVVSRRPRPARVAKGPAPPLSRPGGGPAVEITLALPFTAGAGGRGPSRAPPAGRRAGGAGAGSSESSAGE